MIFLDCTLRDGGYYNSWNYPTSIINEYLQTMQAIGVDYVELGLRSLINNGFKGACAYTSDDFVRSLEIPNGLKLGVMLNAVELIGEKPLTEVLQSLFPESTKTSPISLVRIACHVHEFSSALPAVKWLKERGFKVGFNLMQVADRSEEQIKTLALEAEQYPIDALYFADSMGSMKPEQTAKIISWFRAHWQGALGIHTHDNLGLALSNTLRALDEGVTWVDATVTGMGRGPGNARTEELAIEVAELRKQKINIIPLMKLISKFFKPMQISCGWGSNPYYFLAGKYGIHPTYIQHMLGDTRFSEEDILAVIDYLHLNGGKNFNFNTLDSARNFQQDDRVGSWKPRNFIEGRNVLLLGTGPSVVEHKAAIEKYIRLYQPVVIALNAQQAISPDLINYRVACHPVRLMADCEMHKILPQPLITPYSRLPNDLKKSLMDKKICDFGINVKENSFEFFEQSCTTPTSLVMAYAFAICASGKANQILLTGFDGYEGVDARNEEMNSIVKIFTSTAGSTPLLSLTPSMYDVKKISIYGEIK